LPHSVLVLHAAAGFVKARGYSAKLGADSLQVVPVSQAQARQRSGRAGVSPVAHANGGAFAQVDLPWRCHFVLSVLTPPPPQHPGGGGVGRFYCRSWGAWQGMLPTLRGLPLAATRRRFMHACPPPPGLLAGRAEPGKTCHL
jgi:hypothetical protein